MYSTPDPPQQWSVHAEFTINHPGVGNPQNPPKTGTVQDENGIKMTYSWRNDPLGALSQDAASESVHAKRFESDRLYGFRKGNIYFTSTPPKSLRRLAVPAQDSAYGSDTLSPGSCNSTSCNPFSRKCRSTCNIILSGNAKRTGVTDDASSGGHSSCGRTQSLRCQTPSVCSDRKDDGFYGCGDPWCHHVRYNDDFSTVRRVSPVREISEDLGSVVRANCGETGCSICARDADVNRIVKRDVSVQTYEMVSKCTSPMLKMVDSDKSITTGKLKRQKTVHDRSRKSSKDDSASPIALKRNTSKEESRTLTRAPSCRGVLSKNADKRGSGSDSKSGDSSKKPRTIHIDVYCTGTDVESDDGSSSTSSSSRSKTVSTPQTVFESKNVSVTHKNADDKIVPYHLKKIVSEARNLSKITDTSMEREDSDNDDDVSTSYPSKMSSYSTMGRSLSSMSSFPNSATPFSVSTCTVPDYESSIGNTSWKDTFSDIDSLLHSKSSIPQNDSSYFVPKKIYEEETITEDDSSKVTGTTNSVNLHLSDSFEYADSEDKLRIRRMERMWKNYGSKGKLLKQQEHLQDIVNQRLKRMNLSKDSDSDASDKSEKGWAILKNENNNAIVIPSTNPKELHSLVYKSPSAIVIQQRLCTDPSLGSPFTKFPGEYTEPRYIARRFGPVISVFKKPGHHIGPAKNSNCSCEHCRTYFENAAFRNRTCSLGDTPSTPFFNWKGLKKND